MPRPDLAYSEQRIAVPARVVPVSEQGALELGEAYWREVVAYSHGLVRVRWSQAAVELVLLGIPSLVLLRFGPAATTVSERGVECRFAIEGGLLASEPGGHLVLAQHGSDPVEVSLAVRDYSARLAVGGRLGMRRRLFATLQVPLHEGVSRRFLERAAGGRL